MNLRKLFHYLFNRNQIPLLPRGFVAAEANRRIPTYEEGIIMARRLARTPDQAARLLAACGGNIYEAVKRNRPPRRKKAPVGKRLRRAVRRGLFGR